MSAVPAIWEDDRYSPAQAKKLVKLPSQPINGVVVCACHPSYVGGIGKRIVVRGHTHQKKKAKKKAGNMAQVLEHLPSKCGGLSSNPIKKKVSRSA
jgi:hypothetical protein